MTGSSERAMSFGAIAPEYDRLRPSPPPDAVRWLLPDDCAVAVDLAAGTGLLTRAMAGAAADLVAVEPDARMAEVLRARSRGVRVVRARGEALPLKDQSTDAVLVSSAWHWMTPELAVPEIARVLRDGARFGVIWTTRDRSVDWVRDLDWLREPAMGSEPPSARRHDVQLPDSRLFTGVREASFGFKRPMTIDDLVGMLATYSGLITASEAERAGALARLRDALVARFGDAAEIDVPMRSLCWRADRSPRQGG